MGMDMKCPEEVSEFLLATCVHDISLLYNPRLDHLIYVDVIRAAKHTQIWLSRLQVTAIVNYNTRHLLPPT